MRSKSSVDLKCKAIDNLIFDINWSGREDIIQLIFINQMKANVSIIDEN